MGGAFLSLRTRSRLLYSLEGEGSRPRGGSGFPREWEPLAETPLKLETQDPHTSRGEISWPEGKTLDVPALTRGYISLRAS